MATIRNARDILLQATVPRTISVSLPPSVIVPAVKALNLSSTSLLFQVSSAGVATPSSITITAELVQIVGTVAWSILSGTATLTGAGNSRSIAASSMSSSTVVVQASVTEGGTTYTRQVTIVKATDGSNGTNGTNGADGSAGATGTRTATGYVYYAFSTSSAPAAPTATAYNYTTGAFTSLTSNWSTTFTAPTPSGAATASYWASRYYVTEATFGGIQSINFTSAFKHQNFDGLVTFTNLAAPSGTTFIDGGNLITGTVTADIINVNGTSGINLISGGAVGKIKLDGSGNLIIQGTASNKSIGLLAPNGGGLRVDDFTNFGETAVNLIAPGGSGNARLQTIGGHLTLAATNGFSPANITIAAAFGGTIQFTGTLTTTTTSVVTNWNADRLDGKHGSEYCDIFVTNSGTATVANGINLTSTVSGTQFVGSGNTVTLQSVSDRRLKRGIEPEQLGLEFVKSLKPVTYYMSGDVTRLFHGFVAQDIEPLITDSADVLFQKHPDGSLGVDYLGLIAPLVKAVQELTAQVADLRGRIAGSDIR